jgi:hypothetical protein
MKEEGRGKKGRRGRAWKKGKGEERATSGRGSSADGDGAKALVGRLASGGGTAN